MPPPPPSLCPTRFALSLLSGVPSAFKSSCLPLTLSALASPLRHHGYAAPLDIAGLDLGEMVSFQLDARNALCWREVCYSV